MKFADRYGPWALIAGASEGVGASVARVLGERGVNVVLVGRRQAGLDEVAKMVKTQTRNVILDLNDPQAAQKLIDATADIELGLIVYNAGAAGCVPPRSFLDNPIEHWQAIVSRNAVTVVTLAHHFGGRMAARGRGGIVLVGSTSAWAGTANMAIYAGTKAFQLMFAESLWAEFKPRGVDVLAMVLGPTDTPAFRRLLGEGKVPGVADCDQVALEMLDGLADGPTWPPGPTPFSNVPRRDAVERRVQMKKAMFGADA
jgi:short-subunit dehydrogenase